MKNVLLVAYCFPPAAGPAVQRSAKFAKYLPEFGYRPVVLTAAEEEIEGAIHAVRDPTLLEDLEETSIVRCRGYERWIVNLPRKLRLSAITSFLLRPDKNILAWVPCAQQVAERIASRQRIEAIYTSIGPFSSVLLGARLKKRLGVPWVVDYRDPWTDDGMGVWPSRLHYRLECFQERRALERADAVVVVTPGMREMMLRRYPHLASRLHLIPNGFDRADFAGTRPDPPKDLFRISYTGACVDYDFRPEVVRVGGIVAAWLAHFGYRNGHYDMSTYSPLYLLRAVRELLNRQPERAKGLEICFAGLFGERNRSLVRELGLQSVVREVGYLPHPQSVDLLFRSDLLFLALPSPANGGRSYHYSGKIFEYMASGRPILGAVPPGDARDLIEQARAGWCVDPHDTGRFADLLGALMDRKLRGCLTIEPDRAQIDPFDRRALTGRLAAIFDCLTSGVRR